MWKFSSWKLDLIDINGNNKIGIIKKLSLEDLDKLIALQKEIISGLKDKQEYADTEREVFEDYLKGKATILGCFVESELIAMGVYVSLGIDEDNYGYDLGIEGDQLLKVCQIESTVVKKNYRGNGLQKIICNMSEDINRIKVLLAEKKKTNGWLSSQLGKDEGTIKKEIVGYNNTHIMTMNDELIPISKIKDIYFSK